MPLVYKKGIMCMFSSPEVSVEKKANNEHRKLKKCFKPSQSSYNKKYTNFDG